MESHYCLTLNDESKNEHQPVPSDVTHLRINREDSRSYSNFNLNYLFDNLIKNNPNIISLCTNYQEIKQFPNCLQFMHLKILKVSGNSLHELPDLPDSLEVLNISNNYLRNLNKLPTSLKEFDCYKNYLSILPNLPITLIKVDVSRNQLKSLLILPPKLFVLLCEDNQIQTIGELPITLKSLNISNNQLISLPIFPEESALQVLYCNNNSTLTSLPDLLPPILADLNCSHTSITYLPELDHLEQFYNLNCSCTLITELPPLPFSINSLNCSCTLITELPQLYKNLFHLNVSCTLIQKLDLPKNLVDLSCNSNHPFAFDNDTMSVSYTHLTLPTNREV